jgi:hypothetical protein
MTPRMVERPSYSVLSRFHLGFGYRQRQVCYALFDMNQVRLRQNAFDRWIIVDAANENMAWSGSRFVPMTDEGFPASDVQVSNLDTREEAAECAASFVFEVVATTIH